MYCSIGTYILTCQTLFYTQWEKDSGEEYFYGT